MKKLITNPLLSIIFVFLFATTILNSCKKDNSLSASDEKTLLKLKSKTLLSKNPADLSSRLDVIKSEFYKRKLDANFTPKDEKSIIWTPEWSNPKIQTINDSVSYVFYRLVPTVKREGKLLKAQEAGAATYIMVKNEKEFYKAFFYLPSNLRSKNPSDDSPELIMKNFTGKLMLSNLESKQSFLLDYKNGSVSDEYKKNRLAFRKIQSVGSATSYWGENCNYEMRWCTYVTYNQVCSGGFIVEYSPTCTPPQYCQQGIWILTDYDYAYVCEQVWYPDPPTDPENPGGSEESFDPENPGDKYEFENTRTDSIKLKDVLECFDNVPTDANTTYSVKICADVPDNINTSYFITNLGKIGHTFLELTKTNGSNSVTQTIGFYPESQKKATSQLNVDSRMHDNSYDEYDASVIKMLNEVQFADMLAAAELYSENDYNLTGFNCTTYALDVYNSAGPTLAVATSNTHISLNGSSIPFNLGLTPNGLYHHIKSLYYNNGPGASPFSGTGAVSTQCN